MKKVSVIVPVYNVEPYIKKCLDSIVNQTLKDLEIILVDDGSTDNSGKICDEYAHKDERIIVIHEMNMGLSCARNVGLNIAQGEYVGFVDSDDYISLEMYETLYKNAKENNADFAFCNLKYIGNEIEENDFELIPKDRILNKKDIDNILLKIHKTKILRFVWKGLYKTELAKKIKFISNTFEDSIFNLEMLCLSVGMIFVDKALYYYVQRENSIMSLPYKNDFLFKLGNTYKEKLRIYEKYNVSGWEKDLYSDAMKHIMPMIISNEKNHKCSFFEKIETLRKIRNSELVHNTFKQVSVFEIKSKVKYIILLLKLRLYFLICLLLKK